MQTCVMCTQCGGSGSKRDYTCWKCGGLGYYYVDNPPAHAGSGRNSSLITVMTAFGIGAFIWFQYQNGILAIIGMLVSGYLASTRIGTIVFGFMWIILIAFIVVGLTRN